MPRDLLFIFPLKNGFHARPASAFQELANRYASTVTVVNEMSGATANGKSTLALVSTMTKEGDRCVVRIEGPDADRAADGEHGGADREAGLGLEVHIWVPFGVRCWAGGLRHHSAVRT